MGHRWGETADDGRLTPLMSSRRGSVKVRAYVVKKIVTRHDGTITVASTEGVGTTVTVCLPVPKSRA